MNGEGIVNTSEGKPGARAPNFPVEEEKNDRCFSSALPAYFSTVLSSFVYLSSLGALDIYLPLDIC